MKKIAESRSQNDGQCVHMKQDLKHMDVIKLCQGVRKTRTRVCKSRNRDEICKNHADLANEQFWNLNRADLPTRQSTCGRVTSLAYLT